MDRALVEEFLLRETLKSKEKEEKRDWLWDAIWKAHLDTVTGVRTGNLKMYSEVNCDQKDEKKKKENRKTLWSLYQIIKKAKTPLNSKDLMKAIQPREPGEIEFAALQKLVNMTLKYIIILNLFEDIGIEVNEENCDCPIDSIILEALDKCCKKVGMECVDHGNWTEMKEDTYQKVQAKIKECLETEYLEAKGNIWFDFLMW